jgi:hypothetical protein
MFETSVQETRIGIRWGVVVGLVALAVLLGTGYLLVT